MYPVSLDGNGQVIYLCPFCIVGGWFNSRYTGDDWWKSVGIVGVSDEVNEQMAERGMLLIFLHQIHTMIVPFSGLLGRRAGEC